MVVVVVSMAAAAAANEWLTVDVCLLVAVWQRQTTPLFDWPVLPAAADADDEDDADALLLLPTGEAIYGRKVHDCIRGKLVISMPTDIELTS